MACKCDVCGQSFPLNIQLVIHKRVKHPDPDTSGKDTQVRPQPKQPLDEGIQALPIIIHKSVEECILNLGTGTGPDESEDTSEGEGVSEKVKYKLKSTFQPGIALKAGLSINDKPVDEVMKMDHSTGGLKGNGGPSLTNALLFSKLLSDLRAREMAVVESLESSRCQDSTNQILAKQSFPSVIPKYSTKSESKMNEKTSEPINITSLRKSSRIRSLSDASNDGSTSTYTAISEYTCVNCGKVMSNQKNFILHLRYHDHGSADARKLTFHKRNSLQINSNVLKKFSCKKCGKTFSQFKKFWKHRLNLCELVFKHKLSNNKSSLKYWQAFRFYKHGTTIPRNAGIRSNGKSRISQNQNGYMSDRSEIREEVHSTQFNCRVPGCFGSYSDVILLRDHVKNDHRVFMCLYCESVLLTQSQLDIHIQKRHGKEAYHNYEKNKGIQETRTCGKNLSSTIGTGSTTEHTRQLHASESPQSLNNEDFKVHGTKILDTTVSLTERDHKVSDTAIILPQKSKTETAGIQRKSLPSPVRSSPSPISSNQGAEARHKRPCASIGSFQPVEKAARLKQSSPPGEEERTCLECNVVFNTNRLLRLHLERESCKKKLYTYACKLCSQGFSREASLKNHIKSQHEDIANSDDNGSSSSNASMFRQPTEAEKQRQCTICAKIFATGKILNSHIATHHPTDDIVPSRVSLKSSRVLQSPGTTVVGNNWTISRDTDRAESKYGLSRVPEADFGKKPQAVAVISPQHPRIQGDQRLKCNDCGDYFQSNTELVQHLLWHNETKGTTPLPTLLKKVAVAPPPEPTEVLVKCVICGGGFHKRGDMIAHVKIRHSRRGVFACMECNKRFQRGLDLVDHSIIHDKEFMRRNSKDFIDNLEEVSETEEMEDEEDDIQEERDEQTQYSNSKIESAVSKRISSKSFSRRTGEELHLYYLQRGFHAS
ncbi:unnamed protein product [Allacma fusca]|uniref:C2H2-type domain-containing protein n=1 Tax=Allacma fusca TaxID=39272 RepID=A0A8J2L9J4_9HEXA|nr:unnamed protein product [Allacma fusca]